MKHLRGKDFHEGIHEARKRFKKIRTLLRAMRSELGTDKYQDENTFFRDIARSVGAVRDAQSLIECLEKLKELSDENVRSEVVLKLTVCVIYNCVCMCRQPSHVWCWPAPPQFTGAEGRA